MQRIDEGKKTVAVFFFPQLLAIHRKNLSRKKVTKCLYLLNQVCRQVKLADQ